MRRLQIGIMGSMADLNYSEELEKLAQQLGEEIAKNNAILVFGAEKDSDSLSTAACRGARKNNGLTVGITYGKGLDIYEKNVDVVIATGMERGGGRELSLVLSCDAIITISGGSGTLNEITVAYQAGIPIIALENSGGWSANLVGKFLDSRNRVQIVSATDAVDAVEKAIAAVHHNQSF